MSYSRNILEVKRKAMGMGLCGDYKNRWDNAKSNLDLIGLASDMNGADFVCSSITKKWGVDCDFIKSHFMPYINGNHTHEHKGYKSAIYVDYTGDIECRVTILIVLFSKCIIHIPKGHYCHIFIAGESSDVKLMSDGYAKIHKYDGKVEEILKYSPESITYIDPTSDKESWLNF